MAKKISFDATKNKEEKKVRWDVRNISKKRPKKVKKTRKVMCPFCFNNIADDIINIRIGFYCCRKCGEYFLFDTSKENDL